MSQSSSDDVVAKPAKAKKPGLEFLLTMIGGGIFMIFSTNLTTFTQNYFVGNLLAENSFILSLITMILAGLFWEKPERHVAYGLTIVILTVNEFVILNTLFMTIPVSALGIAGALLTFFGGLMTLAYAPMGRGIAT